MSSGERPALTTRRGRLLLRLLHRRYGGGRRALHEVYVRSLRPWETLADLGTRIYFHPFNLPVHAVVYPLLMGWEGGDFHLFLDGISIEAVMVGIMVGIRFRLTDKMNAARDEVASARMRSLMAATGAREPHV